MAIIQKLFPKFALKREQARLALAYTEVERKRLYDAGKYSSQRKPIDADGSGNAAVQAQGDQIRNYARNLDENHDVAIGILNDLVTRVVGAGMTVMPAAKKTDGTLDTEVNDQITKAMELWGRQPESTRTMAFDEMQRLICRTWLRDGEVLIQRLKGNVRGLDHPTNIPYSLELIEPDFLPLDFNDETKGIIQGVEVNSWGQPKAFHLYKQNPQDIYLINKMMAATKRVNADKILHLKFSRRIGQVRGVSILHGVITRLEDMKDYEESERIAARVAAAFTAFIKKDPALSTPADTDEKRQLEMNPGMIWDELRPGEDVGMIKSDRPNTGLEKFRNAMLKAVAAGTGTNYSTISNDYSGTYSSQRQSMVESAPEYEKLRSYFIKNLLEPIYQDLIEMAFLSGEITPGPTTDLESLTDAKFRGLAQPWVDPLKEANADIALIDANIKSRQQVIRERGGDTRQVDMEIENDEYKVQAAEPEPKPSGSEEEPEEELEEEEEE